MYINLLKNKNNVGSRISEVNHINGVGLPLATLSLNLWAMARQKTKLASPQLSGLEIVAPRFPKNFPPYIGKIIVAHVFSSLLMCTYGEILALTSLLSQVGSKQALLFGLQVLEVAYPAGIEIPMHLIEGHVQIGEKGWRPII